MSVFARRTMQRYWGIPARIDGAPTQQARDEALSILRPFFVNWNHRWLWCHKLVEQLQDITPTDPAQLPLTELPGALMSRLGLSVDQLQIESLRNSVVFDSSMTQ